MSYTEWAKSIEPANYFENKTFEIKMLYKSYKVSSNASNDNNYLTLNSNMKELSKSTSYNAGQYRLYLSFLSIHISKDIAPKEVLL